MAVAEQQERLSEILGGKYQILCRIGGGGMAQVFLARHRIHGGLFAVKVLAPHLAEDPGIVARFEQEARMAASLASHPNIVPIFDIGEGGGLHYLVMQFIPGEDLASYVRREGKLSLPDAANVVAQATEALSCAEARQIVHRDLKLANMLLDEGGRIKLLDFGISRIRDSVDGLTRPGESVGTPCYMSPEQVRGEVCDTRSDLYSLGVVLFELLTGRYPFESESATAIQIAHLTTPPPSLMSIDPTLPAACDAIVQKLLAKRPDDRYQSTKELLDVLVAYGATAGPGLLRPKVDPGLQEALRRAQEIPVDRHATAPLPAIAGEPTAPPPIAAAPDAAPASASAITPAPGTAAPPSNRAAERATEKPRRGLWIGALVAVLILAIAGAGAFFFLERSKQPATSAIAPASPAVYSDAHGRMLLVPAGDFLFDSGGGAAAQKVNLPAFYVDETEVSNAEYRKFCDATGHTPPQTPDYAAHPNDPVSGVSYDDAAAYAAWAGKSLPTEQQWEKAARGTDARTYPWGDAPWTGDVPNGLQPVLSNPSRRSPYGAYNMAGNVWEWTATSFAPSPADNGAMKRLLHGQSFANEWRVIKGGSFAPGGSADFAVTNHRGLPTDARSPWIGFRCVRPAGGAN